MFGSIGGAEFLLILVLALLLFGPRKLPGIGRTLGRALAEFRGATQEFRSSLEREVELDDLKSTRADLSQAGREAAEDVRGVARGAIDPPVRSGAAPTPGPTGADAAEPGADGEPRQES